MTNLALMANNQDIGKNLRKIRELKGYSQEYIATAIDISQRNYSRIEQNEIDLNLSKLYRISEILEVTPQQIMGFDEQFVFSNCTNAFGINENYYACSEQEKEQYKDQIKHLKGEIDYLRKQLTTLLNK